MATQFNDAVRFTNDVQMTGTGKVPDGSVNENSLTALAAIPRSKLAQDVLAVFSVPLIDFRVWDELETLLDGTSDTDDLALIDGTFGTDAPSIQTSDLKNLGATTRYARVLIPIPAEYDDGQTLTLRISCGMLTTVASASATIDAEVYLSDREGAVGADLASPAAQDCNSVTLANKDFVIDPSGLVSGNLLDVRLALAVNDSGTGTAVIGFIGAVELLADIKG